METLDLRLVTITNPSPGPIQVWIAGRLSDVLKPRQSLKVVLQAGLAIRSPEGKAKVVLQIESAYGLEEEWIETIGKRRFAVRSPWDASGGSPDAPRLP